MNKKGTTSFASVLSIPEILLVIFVILAVIFLISGSLLKNADSRDSQSRIIALTPLYSTGGVSYYDEDLLRVIVGTIDLAKFNDETLEKSMQMPENKIIAAKFTLYEAHKLSDSEQENKGNENNKKTEKNEIKSAYYNKEWYELWKPLSGYPGAGGSQTIITERYVILKDSSEDKVKKDEKDKSKISEIEKPEKFQKTALLRIEVITPNS